ncbi:GH25 family lysozyme [Frondihabitans australicus]|uniref:GH25 family lysozyme M1 (1,4-beta-N-acetylmuramidase) n=1 Tax=Frondihabitans australicus TaxID=386892 RepID=A0A495IES7_9MICO|nr:GH25 family lysozyme [Frondihabitans australicus]RKR73998.1 GH25 family lysozyme M1 (1,4-beta-N-acetylmuramidase) [Frondihabitans australicus]
MIRASVAIAAAALTATGVVAGSGAAVASTATCYQSTPTSTAAVKGFDIFEGTGASPDFSGARAKGACFVYIKASGGVKVTNANFDSQWQGARAAGLLTGTYHLAAPNTGTGAQQAAWFLGHDGQWSADGRTLPPALDLEVNDQQTGVNACYNMTPSALVAWIQQFSGAVRVATTRTPIIYTSKSFWADCMNNTNAFMSHALWVTSPGTSTPALPANFASYSFWQTSLNTNGTDPFPGDQDTFHGTLAQLEALTNPSAAHDYTGDGVPDILSLSAGGTLHSNTGAGNGTLTGEETSTGRAVDGRWRIIPAGDLDGDGVADVLAIDPSGNVVIYYGKAGGGLGTNGGIIAKGWNAFPIVAAVGDFTGDGLPDFVVTTKSGQLWLVPFTKYRQFGPHTVLSTNFTGFTAIAGGGDYNGDGYNDLIARTAAGQLWIVPHTAKGLGTHIVGPSGLASATQVFSVGDFDGDGRPDVLTRTGGVVSLYAGDGAGHFAAPVTVSGPAELGTTTFVG